MIRRRALLGAALALPHVARASAATAINLIVGAAPGSGPDMMARAFAPFLERHFAHARVIVSNRPGSTGLVAYHTIADASEGGATLGFVATPTLPARSVDHAGEETLLSRLRLIASVQKEPICLVSAVGTGLASGQDLIRRSAENADAVPIGTPQAGSPGHLAALRLQSASGQNLNIAVFPSAAAARQAALDGHVAAAVLGLSDAIDALRAGTLSGLGIAAAERADAFPDMPPLRDSGLGFAAAIRRGLAAPAGLPDEIAARLATALQSLTEDPEFRAQGDTLGFTVALLSGPLWTARAASERAELAAIWQATPWDASGAG